RASGGVPAARLARRGGAVAAAAPGAGFRGHPRGRTGVHHAHRRPRHAPHYLAKVSGAEVRTGAMARELAPAGRGWRLTVGSAVAPGQVDADAVIIAVPARPAGR